MSVFPAVSRLSAVLKSIPFFAPLPLPTMIATGVASPRAQGQLITRTDIPLASEKPMLWPLTSQITIVINAIPITTGTKMPETLSAIFAIGALVAEASETILIIFEIAVSCPTDVALHSINPLWLIVAAETLSPAFLSTGMLSPVKADSSTALSPFITIASTGILSPARTTKISPTSTDSAGITCSFPSLTTVAVSGASFIKLLSAFVVFPFEYASNVFPTVISVNIIAADSKYKSCIYVWAEAVSPTDTAFDIKNMIARLYPKAAPEPRATSVSIFGALWIKPLKPLIKNFWLITITATVKISWNRAIEIWLLRKSGIHQPHIICPIETYISGINKITDEIKRLSKIGVCSSFKVSLSAFFTSPADFSFAP